MSTTSRALGRRPPSRLDRSAAPVGSPAQGHGYLTTLLTWVLVFMFFFPVLWMIMTSFKTEGQAASFPASSSSPRPLRAMPPCSTAAWACTC